MELQVNAPPPFNPEQSEGATPAPAAPVGTPPPAEEGNPWRAYWTDQNAGRVLIWTRRTLAKGLSDPSLEPDKATVELAAPPLAACMRALPFDRVTQSVGVPGGAKWAIIGLVVILALAVGLPLILALRRRAARAKSAERTAAAVEAPPEEDSGAPNGAWRAGPRIVGSGILGE